MTKALEGQVFQDPILKQLLMGVRRVATPSAHLAVVLDETEGLEPGEVMMSQGQAVFPGGEEQARRLASRLERELRIPCKRNTRAGYEGDVLARMASLPNAPLCEGVMAPWYVRWYAKTELCPSAIRPTLKVLAAGVERKGGRALYRGESELYESVRSTLSRKMETTDSSLLAQVSKHAEEMSAPRRRVEGHSAFAPEIQASLQHRGAPTNYVDFTKCAWVALFFATGGCSADTGRVWTLDPEHARITGQVIDATKNADQVARVRAEAQSSVLVEVPDGLVPEEALDEAAVIPGGSKEALRKFLSEELQINEESLFPDMEALVNDKRLSVPCEVAVKRWMEQMETARAELALWEIEAVMKENPDKWERDPGVRYAGRWQWGSWGG